jgi:hypothetical protein
VQSIYDALPRAPSIYPQPVLNPQLEHV